VSDLPRGWCWAKLGELCDDAPHSMTDGPFGSNLKSEHYCASGVRVVRLGNIGVGRFVRDDEAFIAPSRLTELSKHRCFAGDLLIAALAEPVGRCAPVPDDLGPAIVKADCIRFKPRAEIDAAYLMHELNSPGGLARTAEASHGVGRLRINLGELREVLVPVAPLAEQQRIVAKLDELLARSRAAREALAAIPPLLDRYRQSVLAAAFRGELTAGWRARPISTR
jgi:type I restriction enzyme S subunit